MQDIHRALRLKWVPFLFTNLDIGTQGVREYLETSSNINITRPLSGKLVVGLSDYEEFLSCSRYDTFRFLSSALESFALIESNAKAPLNASWKCIKAYYSAFYYAQALLRLSGVYSTFVTPKLLNNLNVNSIGSNDISGMSSGGHFITLDAPNQQLLFEKGPRSGGSHLMVWKKFGPLLKDALQAVKGNATFTTKQKLEIAQSVDLLRRFLRKGQSLNDFNWLSDFRNEVSYSLTHDSWHPNATLQTKVTISKILRKVNIKTYSNLLSANNSTYDLISFFECSGEIQQIGVNVTESLLGLYSNNDELAKVLFSKD